MNNSVKMKSNKMSIFRISWGRLTILALFFIFIILVILVPLFSIIFHYGGFIQINIGNRNNYIHIPSGTVLYDLNTYAFRNRSLYRYNSKLLLLDENREFDDLSETESNGDVTVIIATLHENNNNNDISVKCRATCNCYNEKMENRRIGGELVYSYRFASVVLVSLIGLATARFVDRHIDECYGRAKEVMGYGTDDGDISDISSLLTCYMDDTECEKESFTPEEVRQMTDDDITRVVKVFKCNGHCIKKKVKFKQFNAQMAFDRMDCDSHKGAPQVIEIRDTMHFELMTSMYHYKAVNDYREQFLTPFCRSIKTDFLYKDTSEKMKHIWKKISPCGAGHFLNFDVKNIECEIVIQGL